MGQNGRKDDDNTRRKRTPSLPSHEPVVQRNYKKQRRWKIVDPLLCRPGNDYNCFSHNYSCKSAQSLRGSRRNVSRIWILSRGKTRCGRTVEFLVRAKYDDPTHKELLLQRYGERIEKLSQQDKLSKFCTDAGFLTTVEVGQYFMTKDTEEFLQFTDAVACREYTLPRDEDTSEPKGWIRGNTKIGPALEVTTCCLHGKYGVEIRIMSMNKDNSHSWVGISHGWNKLVTDLNNKEQDDNEQETSEMQFEEYALRLNASDFASRSKAKQNHKNEILPAHPQDLYLLGGKLGLMLNQENCRYPIIQCRRN